MPCKNCFFYETHTNYAGEEQKYCTRFPDWKRLDDFGLSERAAVATPSSASHYCGEWKEKEND